MGERGSLTLSLLHRRESEGFVSRKWLRERSKDIWYRKAKEEGYRSRAAYKLLQIQAKFGVIREGARVVDLGAAPGGWSMVAREVAGEKGRVVGIDLVPIEPIEGVVFLRRDLTKEGVVEEILDHLGGKASVVLSDMSPSIGGIYSVDHARSLFLAEKALEIASRLLSRRGAFVCKVFSGEGLSGFVRTVRGLFEETHLYVPPATRKSSSEVYVVAWGFKGRSWSPSPLPPSKIGWKEGDPLPPRLKSSGGSEESTRPRAQVRE